MSPLLSLAALLGASASASAPPCLADVAAATLEGRYGTGQRAAFAECLLKTKDAAGSVDEPRRGTILGLVTRAAQGEESLWQGLREDQRSGVSLVGNEPLNPLRESLASIHRSFDVKLSLDARRTEAGVTGLSSALEAARKLGAPETAAQLDKLFQGGTGFTVEESPVATFKAAPPLSSTARQEKRLRAAAAKAADWLRANEPALRQEYEAEYERRYQELVASGVAPEEATEKVYAELSPLQPGVLLWDLEEAAGSDLAGLKGLLTRVGRLLGSCAFGRSVSEASGSRKARRALRKADPAYFAARDAWLDCVERGLLPGS